MPKNIRKWLKARGISDYIINKSELSYNNGWVRIPVINKDGYCQFSKFRRDPDRDDGPKYRYEKGSTATLYNAWMNQAKNKVVLTEGEFDALALQSAGIPAVSSTGGSKTFKDEWVDFFADRTVVIVYDYDEAGIKGALNALSYIPHARIGWLPHENDVTDYLLAHGVDDMKDVLNNSKHYQYEADSQKKYRELAENMIAERKDLEQAAMPAIARTEHTRILQDYYLEQADKLKKQEQLNRVPANKQNGLHVEEAKQVPIEKFLDFNNSGFASCLWHNDNHPSLHYYEKDNRVHCFTCGKQWDVIDVVEKKYDKNFKEAVAFINANR